MTVNDSNVLHFPIHRLIKNNPDQSLKFDWRAFCYKASFSGKRPGCFSFSFLTARTNVVKPTLSIQLWALGKNTRRQISEASMSGDFFWSFRSNLTSQSSRVSSRWPQCSSSLFVAPLVYVMLATPITNKTLTENQIVHSAIYMRSLF